MQRPQRWIGLSLILTTVLRLSRPAIRTTRQRTTVHDQLRQAPLQAGENVIVRAVERVGPAVVRIDTVKEVSNPLGRVRGPGPSTASAGPGVRLHHPCQRPDLHQ